MNARLRLGLVVLALVGSAACNTVFGLDPLTYQDPRVGAPIPDADTDADPAAASDADLSADANTSETSPSDAATNDASDASDANDGG